MSKEEMNINDFRKEGLHLPKFLKDFHDQKDFFKAMSDTYEKEMSERLPGYYWRTNHEYTIDFFLWFCALHGYSLQKIRSKKVIFKPLDVTFSEYNEKSLNALSVIINNMDKHE